MNTEQTFVLRSGNVADTENIAVSIGERLSGGEVIELVSDLGGGKTTFVQGLAKGMGSPDKVASPTFTISREYRAENLTMVHFDFYRLHDPGIVALELAEAVTDPQIVTIVEWGDIVDDVLPANRLRITITATGETSRTFSIACPESLNYLIAEEYK